MNEKGIGDYMKKICPSCGELVERLVDGPNGPECEVCVDMWREMSEH